MFHADLYRASISQQGYHLVPNVVPRPAVDELIAVLAQVDHPGAIRRRGSTHAVRNLMQAVPQVQHLARLASVRSLVEPVLGPGCFVVRAILFDKTPRANWLVAWHQDLTIAVHEEKEAPGFGPWSSKAGIVHVQPPAAVLEGMLAVRLHLDDCAAENGPLRLIPGSHRSGRLSPADIAHWRDEHPAVVCTCARGDALVMRPLILHASSPAAQPGHRRVVHLEFAAEELPAGLQWHGRW